MEDSEEYTLYWDVSTNETGEIVVLYRSYTGTQIRYYINPASGGTYVTELVPGMIDEKQRAGRLGEEFASTLIKEILTDDDVLLTNVPLHAYDRETELDNLVVNSHGLFIIEVKNYCGELIGNEDDLEWIKNNMYPAGSFKQTTVKNPIVQVKRQIFLLSQFLKAHYIDVSIDGYVFLTERNSPVDSPPVLDTQTDMDRVIHSGDIRLTSNMVEQIVSALVPDEE